jgi:hypothetical protein
VYSASSEPVNAPDGVEWKPFPEDRRYKVSPAGDVIGPKGRAVVRLSPCSGRKFITIGKRRTLVTSRVVLITFVGPPRPGDQACHQDGDCTNDALSNLRWGSQAENMTERSWLSSRRGLQKIPVWDHPLIKRQLEEGVSSVEIARRYDAMSRDVRQLGKGQLHLPRLLELMEISCTADLLEVCPSCGQPLSSSHPKGKG